MTLSRTPLRFMSRISFSRYSTNKLIRLETSSAGRFQFSELKANKVTWLMPRSAQCSTKARTCRAPLLWPKVRGRPRFLAQRPLPSMMTATCRGGAPSPACQRVKGAFKRKPSQALRKAPSQRPRVYRLSNAER